MPSPSPRLKFLPCGDSAMAVEFGEEIDPASNARVLALDSAVQGLQAVRETVPTYRSLLVHYDPVLAGFDELSATLERLASATGGEPSTGATWTVPVAYGGEHGLDLEATAALHGITPDELVRRHAAPTYRVYMIGFMPGFAYLGGLDQTIATPRRISPRLKTPAGTISIGGVQALIATIEAPSGWHLLGRTPVRNYMPGRDPVFLVAPGDRVRFRPIAAVLFADLDRAAASGEIVAEVSPPA